MIPPKSAGLGAAGVVSTVPQPATASTASTLRSRPAAARRRGDIGPKATTARASAGRAAGGSRSPLGLAKSGHGVGRLRRRGLGLGWFGPGWLGLGLVRRRPLGGGWPGERPRGGRWRRRRNGRSRGRLVGHRRRSQRGPGRFAAGPPAGRQEPARPRPFEAPSPGAADRSRAPSRGRRRARVARATSGAGRCRAARASRASTSNHGHSSVNWSVAVRSCRHGSSAVSTARPPVAARSAARYGSLAPRTRYSAGVCATSPTVRPSGDTPGFVWVIRTA